MTSHRHSPPTVETIALERAGQALRLVDASLPHLAGLVHLVRLKPSRRIGVAAVAASGLILINPEVFAHELLADAAYVLAHELLHLALNTHGREGETHPLISNFAHDYIINDMLSQELGREPPLDGLVYPDARLKSYEELVVELNQNAVGHPRACWQAGSRRTRQPAVRSPLSLALEEAGLVEKPPELPALDTSVVQGDMIPSGLEADFGPELAPHERQRLTDAVRRAAAKSASLGELKQQMEQGGELAASGAPQRGQQLMHAVRNAYQVPWELALQRWMDAVAPGQRSYARPSRRGGLRHDIVLPGRERHGWTLHLVLDTSGSMVEILPKALGAIALFCEASQVSDVHIIQCDIEVTSDRWVEPAALAEFHITGFGYSDMSPGLDYLARDPDVQAVLVLTDGFIEYPSSEPPYRVLWGLIGDYDRSFTPRYGDLVHVALS